MEFNFLDVSQYYNPLEKPGVFPLPYAVKIKIDLIQSIKIRTNLDDVDRIDVKVMITGTIPGDDEYVLLNVKSLEVAEAIFNYLSNHFNIQTILNLKDILNILNFNFNRHNDRSKYVEEWNTLKIDLKYK